ncbi:MAG: resolvase, partial [Hirschia sp.]|nr:resolvase [Hirschia sp.]
THPGQHEPIIDQVLWDRVQTKLQQASTRPRNITKSGETSLLAGKLFDENGRLTPTHAQKGKRRHRYYVSTHLVKGTARDNAKGWRLPAVPLERIVVEAVRQHLESNMHKLVQSPDIAAIQHANARVLEFVQDVEFCASLIERIEVSRGALKVSIEANALAKLLEAKAADFDSAMLTFTVPFFVRRRGVELKLASGVTTSEPDHILIRAIAQAHEWLEEIKQGTSFSAIARKHDWTDAMIRQRIKLAFLSPRIVQAILEGRQPSHIHLTHLLKTPLSNDWSEQENQLGFYLP